MNEQGQHYEPMQDDDGVFMNQCEPGRGYVRAADYAALAAECEIHKNTANGANNQLNANRLETERLAKDWMQAVAERDAMAAELAAIKAAQAEPVGHQILVFNRHNHFVVREDVAQEYADKYTTDGYTGVAVVPLYTARPPQPSTVALCEALELWLADYDEVAANPDFEPFTHVAERVAITRAALAANAQPK